MSQLFTETIRRYTFNSWAFIRLREKLKLSAKDFADKIGWSFQYQYKLEKSGAFDTISEKTFNEINQVVAKYIVQAYPMELALYTFTGYLKETFGINGAELKRLRDGADINQKEFAIMMGWSKQYQNSLESGIVATVSLQVKNMIESALNILSTT